MQDGGKDPPIETLLSLSQIYHGKYDICSNGPYPFLPSIMMT